jgi:hypothetical protein
MVTSRTIQNPQDFQELVDRMRQWGHAVICVTHASGSITQHSWLVLHPQRHSFFWVETSVGETYGGAPPGHMVRGDWNRYTELEARFNGEGGRKVRIIDWHQCAAISPVRRDIEAWHKHNAKARLEQVRKGNEPE